MNTKLAEFKEFIKDKRVAVLGIGISNTPLIQYLSKLGVDITAFDMAEKSEIGATLEALKGLDIKFSLGKDYLKNLHGFDVIFKTPKVRFDIPELVAESSRGAVITSEMEVFVDLCPAEIFAVTGSDGKTTTTTLIYRMLKEQGFNCWLGGNIGTPLLDRIDEVQETDKVILELSSFQLHTMKNSPHTAVVTNLSPNHLDVHTSMEEYIEAKTNIFRYQKKNDRLILNFDNEITKAFADQAIGETIFFSRRNSLDKGCYIKDGRIIFRCGEKERDIIAVDDIILPGVHNVENYLAAIAATIDYVEPATIRRVASTFKGVEHRIEYVREFNGVRFYNDSIGSSPTRTIASIKAFKQKVILIAGGYDKHIPYDEMGEIILERVKGLVLIGQTGPQIEKALENEMKRTGKSADIPVVKCLSLEEAVRKAYENAVPGDIVLLSPASASFDMFKNFEERGCRFKEIVNSL